MLEVDEDAVFPVEADFLTEVNGLKVAAKFDCDIFNGDQPWGKHWYFWEVPSRWFQCCLHYADIASGLITTHPRLPLVDDEYAEHTAVFQSVLRAAKTGSQLYVFAELGARWGTWGSRAIGFWRLKRPTGLYHAHFIESDPENCGGLRATMERNSIDYNLECKEASNETLISWLESVPHVDVIHLDIQGAERTLLPAAIDLVNAKVYRVIVGTHSEEIHQEMKALFEVKNSGRNAIEPWIKIWEAPHTTDLQQGCIGGLLRRGYMKELRHKFAWDKMLKMKCYHDTP